MSDPRRATLRLAAPLDLRDTFGVLRRGRLDPTVRLEGRTLWRATRTPDGPAAEAVVVDAGAAELRVWAWGPGAAWLLDGLADLAGTRDRRADFDALVATAPGGAPPPGWAAVAGLARRHAGLRIPRTRAVFEAAAAATMEQKVTGLEAHRSWRDVVSGLGEPAPGPAGRRGLLVPPAAATVAAVPTWRLHRMGLERKRAETLVRVAQAARRLDEAAGMDPAAAERRLTAVPGLGPWSAAEVALVALGDPDAVSVGDYNLPHQVAWAFTGRPRGDDELMLRLLEPWRGHRGMVLRLLVRAGLMAPRFGPRQPLRSLKAI